MAAQFPTAQAYTTPPNSHGAQNGLQQFSPSASASGTPMDQSPISTHAPSAVPALPLGGRQLRPPKSPLYVPAALRPTERPHRVSPLTPPRSVHGSTDSLTGSESGRPVSRRSTAESKKRGTLGKVAEDEGVMDSDDLAPVEGTPTRDHWKPDANASICDAPTCQKSFNLFERRHHCRRCGHIFCNAHSQYQIPLDHRADFHPDGTLSRACKHCWDRYCDWRLERTSRSNSVNSAMTATPTTPIPGSGKGKGANIAEGLRNSISNSVPRDWNWSTF
ncbi:MAG: hypothetical protein Q9167_002426 [Letrouitia subvulpina]